MRRWPQTWKFSSYEAHLIQNEINIAGIRYQACTGPETRASLRAREDTLCGDSMADSLAQSDLGKGPASKKHRPMIMGIKIKKPFTTRRSVSRNRKTHSSSPCYAEFLGFSNIARYRLQ